LAARHVLVTGVGRDLGAAFARVLSDEPAVARIVGVDVTEPKGDLGRAEFIRSQTRSPLLAKTLSDAAIDTVVHLGLVPTAGVVGSRGAMKETNVIGSMQLLAACHSAPTVRRLIVRSSTQVYGASPRDPAVFSESFEPQRLPASGFARDVAEVEGYVRGFSRRRPDVDVTILRFTNIVGPQVESVLGRYFALPVTPTMFGFDPRIQLVHADDVLEVLRRAVCGGSTGEHPTSVHNVAGDGVLYLSQALRRLGRVPIPLAPAMYSVAGRLTRALGLSDFAPEQLRFLSYGRIVDATRLVTEFGYTPRFSTAAAFEDLAARQTGTAVAPGIVAAAEAALVSLLPSRRRADG